MLQIIAWTLLFIPCFRLVSITQYSKSGSSTTLSLFAPFSISVPHPRPKITEHVFNWSKWNEICIRQLVLFLNPSCFMKLSSGNSNRNTERDAKKLKHLVTPLIGHFSNFCQYFTFTFSCSSHWTAHTKSQMILKSNDWFKRYGEQKWLNLIG